LHQADKVCFGDAIHGALSHCTRHYHRRQENTEKKQQWVWFGTRWHEIAFVGCAIQMVAASVFWISTITGVPGVIDMENLRLTDGIYWVPQVIGGSGFIISRYVALYVLLIQLIVHVGNTKRLVPDSTIRFIGLAGRVLELYRGCWIHVIRRIWHYCNRATLGKISEWLFHILGRVGILDREYLSVDRMS
jgi:hypothetical protein